MTHDQVRHLVRRINPIPDPSVLDVVDAPVLDLERSKEMQVDERPMAEGRRDHRRRGPVFGIAAAAVVLIAGLIYVSTDNDPVATPAPNAVELPGFDQPLEPGAYHADTDGDVATSTRGTFVIEGTGWRSAGSGAIKGGVATNGGYVSLLIDEVNQVWEDACAARQAAAPAGTTAQALGNQFAAMTAFITIEGLSPVTAFGQEGYHLVVEVPADCVVASNVTDDMVWDGEVFGERYYQAEGQVVEFWFLHVEGTTVMVEATRPPESNEEIVTELNADLDTLLDTLVITP
jgi:hypothetical protein